jgi:hypothetical protein
MKIIKLITLSIVCVFTATAQQTPADNQSEFIAIIGGTAHIGNGNVIQNSLITFENGVLQNVSKYIGTEDTSNMKVINAELYQTQP